MYPRQARQLSPAKSATDEGLVPSGESGEDLVALNLIEDGGQVRRRAPINPSFCIPCATSAYHTFHIQSNEAKKAL